MDNYKYAYKTSYPSTQCPVCGREKTCYYSEILHRISLACIECEKELIKPITGNEELTPFSFESL